MANHCTGTGSLAWAALVDPSEDTYSDKMTWNCGLVIGEEDMPSFLETLEKEIANRQKEGSFPKEMPTGEQMKWPYKPSFKKDDNGQKIAEEGKIVLSFKRNTVRKVNGETVNNSAPQILDSTGQLVVGQKPNPGPGSLVRVIYRPYAYKMKSFSGVTAQLLGVQIVELKERDSLQVDAVDGGWVAEAPRDDFQAILDGDAL